MKPRRILIADSDRAGSERLYGTLAGLGYGVELVTTGTSAVEKLQQGGYSHVLLAERLPDTDGLDCFLRMRRQSPSLEGWLLADEADIKTVFSAVRLGFRHVLPRPVRVEDVVALLTKKSPSMSSPTLATA